MSEKVKKCERSSDADTVFCWAMSERLNAEANSRQKGISEVVVTSMDTGDGRTIGVVYKTGAKDRGLMFNVCPWCGEKILWDKKMTKEAP